VRALLRERPTTDGQAAGNRVSVSASTIGCTEGHAVQTIISDAVRAQPVEEIDQEYAVDADRAEQDLIYGQMAVVIHQPEDWPAGPLCRNCRGPWECPLHNWGVRILLAAGWTDEDMAELVRHAEQGHVPWSGSRRR
jgi:hypothetical protein